MKKFILLILIGFGIWVFYPMSSMTNQDYSLSPSVKTDNMEPIPIPITTDQLQIYQCDGRQHCSQMESYEEAKIFIENCPHTKMDGDNDGVPCERQFNRY